MGRLCVFAGGWDLTAAETVCSGGELEKREILPRLSRLISRSLVAVGEQEDCRRYHLLETIREYGRTYLSCASSEQERLRRAHGVFYIALAEAAESQIWGAEQAVWRNRLEQDHDNLRAAL